jgi:phosphomannomutase
MHACLLDSGVPDQPVSLTPGIAFFIGHSFARWLQSRRTEASPLSGPVRVSLGGDPRISGPMLEAALVAGLAAAGAEVDTFGIATTPCMFYSIVSTG